MTSRYTPCYALALALIPLVACAENIVRTYYADSACETPQSVIAEVPGYDASTPTCIAASCTQLTQYENLYYAITCSESSITDLIGSKAGYVDYSDLACETAVAASWASDDACYADFRSTSSYISCETTAVGYIDHNTCALADCANCTTTLIPMTCTKDVNGTAIRGQCDTTTSSSGTCYHHTSTVTRLVASNGVNTAEIPLSELEVGQRILALSSHGKPTFAKVEALPHGPGVEPFMHIVMASKEAHDLTVTLHHTFDTCASKPSPVIKAMDVKAGSCLHTAEGTAIVHSAKRLASKDGDETYSIKLAGNVDIVAIGGVFTHAMGHVIRPKSSHVRKTVKFKTIKASTKKKVRTTHASKKITERIEMPVKFPELSESESHVHHKSQKIMNTLNAILNADDTKEIAITLTR